MSSYAIEKDFSDIVKRCLASDVSEVISLTTVTVVASEAL